MAELVDALVSGTSVLTYVQVQVLFRALKNFGNHLNNNECRSFFYVFGNRFATMPPVIFLMLI